MVEAIPTSSVAVAQDDAQAKLAEQKIIAGNLTFGENDVGIDLFFSDTMDEKVDLTELKCAFKHRFSDFIVNEIDEANDVVWFSAETDLQKWKACNLDQTLP